MNGETGNGRVIQMTAPAIDKVMAQREAERQKVMQARAANAFGVLSILLQGDARRGPVDKRRIGERIALAFQTVDEFNAAAQQPPQIPAGI